MILRLALIPAFPNLSDDLYRFIWDGYLIHEGINPLTYTPRALIENNILSDKGLTAIFPLLNSPDYFTIYPPVSQLIFFLSTVGGISEVTTCSIIIKCILLVAELLSLVALFKLLRLLKLKVTNLMIYALNPLVIIEVMTNLHFEAIMASFFLWTLFYLIVKKHILSSFMLACSVAAKLLPLMFVPAVLMFLFYHKRWKNYLAYFTLFTVILFTPFFITLDIPNFFKSIDLYFQKFEFNASIYYLLRGVGKFLTGYNQIFILGPLLGLTTLLLILKKVYKSKVKSVLELITVCLFSFTTYLFLTTTVHPWYLIMPIALSVFNPRWYIIAWSFLIILSYSTYANPDYQQNLYLISLEYLIVFGIMFTEKKYNFDKPFNQPIAG